jgi:hypothetical protein
MSAGNETTVRIVAATPSPTSEAAAPTPPATVLTAVDTRFEMRAIMYPALPVLMFALLIVYIVMLKRDEDGTSAKTGTLLRVVGAAQSFFALLWIFAHSDDGMAHLQFLVAGIVTIYYSLVPERTFVGQFVAVVSVINFFCVLGLFPLLGWSSSLFDTIVDMRACVSYFNWKPDPLALTTEIYAKCNAYLNVLAFASLFLACLQPFSALLSYVLVSSNDVLSK